MAGGRTRRKRKGRRKEEVPRVAEVARAAPPQRSPRAPSFPLGPAEMSRGSGRAPEPPKLGGRCRWGDQAPPRPAPAAVDLRAGDDSARPQGASSLRATPPARLPVLGRHAPSHLSASTPSGGAGGAQISASVAAIVCVASLALRRTGLAPGPPSASEVARAPSRPPAPTLRFPQPTRPRSLALTRPRGPPSTGPRVSRLSGLAPSPAPCRALLASRAFDSGHQASRPSPIGSPVTLVPGLASPSKPYCSSASSHQLLQPTGPSSQPVAPCALTPPPIPWICCLCDSHSCASTFRARPPSRTHSGSVFPTPRKHTPLWALHIAFPGLLLPLVAGPWDSLVTPRLPCPHGPLPTAPNQPPPGCRALDPPFSPRFLCSLRTNTPVFLCLGLTPPSL